MSNRFFQPNDKAALLDPHSHIRNNIIQAESSSHISAKRVGRKHRWSKQQICLWRLKDTQHCTIHWRVHVQECQRDLRAKCILLKNTFPTGYTVDFCPSFYSVLVAPAVLCFALTNNSVPLSRSIHSRFNKMQIARHSALRASVRPDKYFRRVSRQLKVFGDIISLSRPRHSRSETVVQSSSQIIVLTQSKNRWSIIFAKLST